MEVAAAGHRLNPKEPFKKPVKLKSDPLCRRQKRTMNRSRIGRTDSSLGLASKDAVSFQPKLQEAKKVKARGILLTLLSTSSSTVTSKASIWFLAISAIGMTIVILFSA